MHATNTVNVYTCYIHERDFITFNGSTAVLYISSTQIFSHHAVAR